jgi:predicted membrane chloride channel (bestrophin family)
MKKTHKSLMDNLTRLVEGCTKSSSLESTNIYVMCSAFYLTLIYLSFDMLSKFEMVGFGEVYSLTTLIHGITLGFYCNHLVHRWWDLRIATGSVSGALADTAMIIGSFMRKCPRTDNSAQLLSIANKLKHIQMIHMGQVLGSKFTNAYALSPLWPVEFPKHERGDLLLCISAVMGDATDLLTKKSIGDAALFSAVAGIQNNMSTVRSACGDCEMILQTQQPTSFTRLVYIFTMFNLVCLPIFIGQQTAWNMVLVLGGAFVAFSILGGFLLIVATEFRNPFLSNTFQVHKITIGTTSAIDSLLLRE